MPYNDITKESFNNLIALRNNDTGKVYRTNSEIDGIINEALLTFGALSAYWRKQILVETTNESSIVKKQIYNLLVEGDVKTGFDNSKVSLTYADVISWLDFDLVDYSDLAELSELIELITHAINEFQSRTKLVLARKQFNIYPGQNITLTDDVLDIINVQYIDSLGVYYPLKLADEQRVSLVNNNLNTNTRPRYYSLANLSLNVIDLIPKPAENGYIEIIYVVGVGENATISNSCIIPNDLVPYLKYKVLNAIFNKEDNKDASRAAYAKSRWEEGIVLGSNYAGVLDLKLNGVNIPFGSITDFDNLRYGWRNDTETDSKRVNSVAFAGYNILGTNRIPKNVYSILLEMNSNAPFDDTYIDLRPDYIPAILDYCIHLSSIKDGIAAIQQTIGYLENFIKLGIRHNTFLQSRKISYLDIIQRSKYPLRQNNIVIEKEENAA